MHLFYIPVYIYFSIAINCGIVQYTPMYATFHINGLRYSCGSKAVTETRQRFLDKVKSQFIYWNFHLTLILTLTHVPGKEICCIKAKFSLLARVYSFFLGFELYN